jgi:hypothetical protein
VGGPLAPRCTHVGITPRVDRLAPHLHAACCQRRLVAFFVLVHMPFFRARCPLHWYHTPTHLGMVTVRGWVGSCTNALWGSLPQHSHASVRAFGPRPHPNHTHVHAFPVGRSTYRTSLFCQQHNQTDRGHPINTRRSSFLPLGHCMGIACAPTSSSQ